MPEGYEIGLFIHLFGVFVLGAATGTSFAAFSMMRRAKTVQEVRVWGALGRILSQYHVAPAAALVLILSGAYLVSEFELEWTDGWIGFSAIAVVVAVIIGYTLITPRMKDIGATAGPAPDGPVTTAITDKLADPILFGAIHGNLLISTAIIWNMTIKPGAFGSLAALVILAGLGWAAAYPMYQRQQGRAA